MIKISGTYSNNAISSSRTSGVVDTIPIDIDTTAFSLYIEGRLCSRNENGHTLIYIKPERAIHNPNTIDINEFEETGYICKTPHYRTTPLGKEITDICLAVPSAEGSDYIPVVAWGSVARKTANLSIGTRIRVKGRIQSRSYTRALDNTQHTAIEVSALDIFNEEE